SKNQIPFLIRSEFPDQVLHLVDVTYMMKRQGFQLLAEHDEMDMCIRESRQHRLTVEVRFKISLRFQFAAAAGPDDPSLIHQTRFLRFPFTVHRIYGAIIVQCFHKTPPRKKYSI